MAGERYASVTPVARRAVADLDWNQVTALPESFGELTVLRHLRLKGNQLTALPKTFVQLTALQYVEIGQNVKLEVQESMVAPLRNLVRLGRD